MKPYYAIYKQKKHVLSYFILLVGILYAAYISYSGVQATMVKQMRSYLTNQMQQAQRHTFLVEDDLILVRLRRDGNNNITAVTVDGILLNQLQMKYQTALNTVSTYVFRISMADMIGSRLLFWLPGEWSISCHPEIAWYTIIKSRTLEQVDGVKIFQLILTTECTAEWCSFFKTELNEEVLLFETVIYTPVL